MYLLDTGPVLKMLKAKRKRCGSAKCTKKGKIIDTTSVFAPFIYFIHPYVLIYWLYFANSISAFYFHSSFILYLHRYVSVVVVFASSVL
jgi:hypothetical protein